MSNFEFQGEIDVDLLADELANTGSFASESYVEDEVRSQLDDLDVSDQVADYLRYTGVNADEIGDLESAVDGWIYERLADDNLDATLKEDLIDAQERIKALEDVVKGVSKVLDAAGFGAFLPTQVVD